MKRSRGILWCAGVFLAALLAGFCAAEEDVPAPPPVEPPKAESPAPTPNPNPAPAPPEDAEPGAETVPLPAPGETDRSEFLLKCETPLIAPGEQAVFSLFGPELFLRFAKATYSLRDEYGREVAQGAFQVQDLPFKEGKPRQLGVTLAAALGRQHTLRLALGGVEGEPIRLQASFQVKQPEASWDRWLTLIAAPPVSGDWRALRDLGVGGGVQYRLNPARREELRKAGVPFFVENVTHQMLSRYQTERGLWEKTLGAVSDPGQPLAWLREPSLCAPAFATAFAAEVTRHAEVYSKDRPLFYSLSSEPSMTRLAAAADFDFSPEAIAEFRRWLEREVYGTVPMLDSAWGTAYKSWGEVQPITTAEALTRLKNGVMNFAPWTDFRAFQDYTFSRVLRGGAELIRRGDPAAKVGITGALGAFAFGGWDWSRLAKSLDVVECYDIGGARDLWRDLAPGKPALAGVPLAASTSPDTDAARIARTLWALALEGGLRGTLLWDEPTPHDAGSALLDDAGKPMALAQALKPTLRTLGGETGWLLSRSSRLNDGVAMLYSPASVRMHWLLEAGRLHPGDWLKAWGLDTSAERCESPQLRRRESWAKLLDDLGLGWRYVSSEQLEKGEILRPEEHVRTLILPEAIALSDAEIEALKKFTDNGGRLVADAACGRFDEHGVLRKSPPLDGLFGVNTSSEPFAPKPRNPLDLIVPNNALAVKLGLAAESLKDLPVAFSDEPKLSGAQSNALAAYRDCPLVAFGPAGVYLNLDLTDYLHWRLHDEQPAAEALREVLRKAVFADRLSETAVDWAHTWLPLGTQVVWLRVGEGEQAPRLLALRRNPQARLREVGWDGDSNAPFDKREPFTLALRKPAWVAPLLPAGAPPHEASQSITGTLDPVTPALFVLHAQASGKMTVQLPAQARAGETVELHATLEGAPEPRLFSVQVFGPDGAPRKPYGVCAASADGKLDHRLPLAFNDPPGEWRVAIHELLNGSFEERRLNVAAAQAK